MRAAVPLLLAFMACAPVIENNGMRVYSSHWQPVEREISARAKIDLQCPAIDVLLLARQGRAPVSVSAEGCGRAAVYQRLVSQRGPYRHTTVHSGWLLVSASPTAPSALADELCPTN